MHQPSNTFSFFSDISRWYPCHYPGSNSAYLSDLRHVGVIALKIKNLLVQPRQVLWDAPQNIFNHEIQVLFVINDFFIFGLRLTRFTTFLGSCVIGRGGSYLSVRP